MITAVSLVNITHFTQLQIFFLVMRTSKIYSLSNFKMQNTVLCSVVTMLDITARDFELELCAS